MTALGNPVVPELKLKKAHISLFFFPLGILKLGTCPTSPYDFPMSKSCFMVVKPSNSPSRRKTRSFGIPAFFAAAAAMPIEVGTVMRYLAPAFWRAYVISSTL